MLHYLENGTGRYQDKRDRVWWMRVVAATYQNSRTTRARAAAAADRCQAGNRNKVGKGVERIIRYSSFRWVDKSGQISRMFREKTRWGQASSEGRKEKKIERGDASNTMDAALHTTLTQSPEGPPHTHLLGATGFDESQRSAPWAPLSTERLD